MAHKHNVHKLQLINAEFELGSLSLNEICSILEALDRHGCLGKLTGTERSYQEEHFIELASKELLVAMRELTSEGTFDSIIKNEFECIGSEIAKQAYVYVAALGQMNHSVRYTTLQHILQLSWMDFKKEVFTPTTGVLITGEGTGYSRHNADFRLSVRHPVIGSVIFAAAAPDDHSKFAILNKLIGRLDSTHPEDKSLLLAIVRGGDLISTFSSDEFKRAIYDRLADVLPDDAFVYQHRARLEKDLDQPESALKFARKAVSLNPNNAGIQNTLGLVLELCARKARPEDQSKKKLWIMEASKIFSEGIKRHPKDPFNYLGSVLLLRQQIEEERDEAQRAVLKARSIQWLEEGLEASGQAPVLVTQLGKQWEQLGNSLEAIKILADALRREPTESRLREFLVTLLERNGQLEEAYKHATAGATVDPTFWRMQRHIARLARKRGRAVEEIKGHYESALRHNKGDVSLLVELASFLFTHNERQDAAKYFQEARELSISSAEKSFIREWWDEKSGKRKIFNSKITRIEGAVGFVLTIPDNFEAKFLRTHAGMTEKKVGEVMQINVGFSAHGPQAKPLLKRTN